MKILWDEIYYYCPLIQFQSRASKETSEKFTLYCMTFFSELYLGKLSKTLNYDHRLLKNTIKPRKKACKLYIQGFFHAQFSILFLFVITVR